MTTDKSNTASDPQPGELAEQQGDAPEIEQLGKLVSRILSTVSLGHQTGPHAYAGEDFGRYLREATSDCRTILRMLPTLAATGKQQVGEAVDMATLDQILLDPENQPSQFGTVPTGLLEHCEEMISDLVHQFGDRGCTCTFPEDDCCAYARAEHYACNPQIVQQPAQGIDPRAALGWEKACAALQVGEVQGDARAQFEAWAVSIGARIDTDEHGNYLSSALNYSKLGWDAALAARQLGAQEPITVEAVATIERDSDGDRYVSFLLEGGISELEAGDVLMVADRSITDDDGSGEVYAAPPAQGIDLGPRPMDTAPRDGTLVRLLVDFDENAIEDSISATWTIGACSDDNVSEGARIGWQFAGWCWTHDHFTEGTGTPVGWLPLIDGQRDTEPGASE